MNFPGLLILPVPPEFQRPVELYRLARAIVRTASAIPAFFGMQDNGWLALLGVWDINIHLADFDAVITAVAFLGE